MGNKKPFRAVPIRRIVHDRQSRQRRAHPDDKLEVVRVLGGAVAVGLFGALLSIGLERPTVSNWRHLTEDSSTMEARERSVFYSGCNDVRAAGAAPLYAGEPGYRSNMDGDGDGIACEPIRN